MKHLTEPVVIIIIIMMGLLLFVGVQNSDKEEIERWAKQEGYTVITSEVAVFDIGPFYYRSRHHRVYKVVVATPVERTTYFRFGTFGYDREWAN